MPRTVTVASAGGMHRNNIQSAPLRRSPRKKASSSTHDDHDGLVHLDGPQATISFLPASKDLSREPPSKSVREAGHAKRNALKEINLPATSDVDELETIITSAQRSRSIRPSHELDLIVSEMGGLSLDKRLNQGQSPKARRKKSSSQTAKPKQRQLHTSRYVLKEADCVDDYSDAPEEEDEDTDLSGFIVDDDAELSYHESAEETSEDEHIRKPLAKSRRRLHRGHRKVVDSDSDKENNSDSNLANALEDLDIAKERPSRAAKCAPEIIDLTSSPIFTSRAQGSASHDFEEDPFASKGCHGVELDSCRPRQLPALFDSLLRLSPPQSSQLGVNTQRSNTPELPSSTDATGIIDVPKRPQTPSQPLTPPRLKSPSKLLSPSKRQTNHRSPHRHSTDAFWDHHTVNDWNDTYSPKKAPIASPRKNPLARFAIWSDTSDDDGGMDDHESSSSLPSPCASPTKPIKSPEKAARAAYLAEKRAEKTRRKAFDAIKDTLARDLLAYLDKTVVSGKISALSASTGGIHIIWSKTLRSTAGRANYKRTVEMPSFASSASSSFSSSSNNQVATARPLTSTSESEVTSGNSPTKRKAHHHATIELAEKVIDRESRLVNTLAHEFCHLADFMLSGMRNQPHGPSFMSWAKKAVYCLQMSSQEGEGREGAADPVTEEAKNYGYRPSWQACEISTKHNYEIEWKYLWVCEGRKAEEPITAAAQKCLNLEVQDGGCGAEYGRHSKSINTDRMRCGRCKGRLVQVRPLPRASPVKNKAAGAMMKTAQPRGSGNGNGSGKSRSSSSTSDGSVGGKLGAMIEVVELSD